jgi:hypothetical protein
MLSDNKSFRCFVPKGLQTRGAWMSAIFTACLIFAGCSGMPGSTSTAPAQTPLTPAQIFSRPVLSRGYEQNNWVLTNSGGTGDRETAAAVGAALAALKPTYVSGLIYLENITTVSQTMIDDWSTIRAAVLAQNPNAKFDVEISLNPAPPAPNEPFASPAALVAKMTTVDSELHPDAWWFDFYSNEEDAAPDVIAAAVSYAHSHGQLVGGNVFGGKVPPGSDAVAFVDDPVSGSQFGFDFSRTEVASLKSSSPSTVLIGHLQSNAQNGPTTESCVYINQWNESQRLSYLTYWASQQSSVGFTFMYPVFYPLCPGGYAFDPLQDPSADGGTLYGSLQTLMNQYNP